ncbi:MAG: hypothetical protein ACI90V_007694, partial [Bacillariaceae sp.]
KVATVLLPYHLESLVSQQPACNQPTTYCIDGYVVNIICNHLHLIVILQSIVDFYILGWS